MFDYVREGPAVGRTFDFILVGPIVEEAKIVSGKNPNVCFSPVYNPILQKYMRLYIHAF